MIQNHQYYLCRRPRGLPGAEDVGIRAEVIGELLEGQLLIQNEYLSIDPAIRGWMRDEPSYMPPIELGAAIRSSTVGKVVQSKHPQFAVGDIVYGLNAWEEYSVSDGYFLTKVPAENPYPHHYYLSILGAVGLTAYFAITEAARLKPGDTLLMSAAAGAVGSIGGQLAKAMGCTVVGLAGSEEKCRWITEELGFDGAINYKTESGNLVAAIKAACPQGVDVYFDNVGGEILDAALLNLSHGGRILFCGAIASYNADEPTPGPRNWWQILAKSITVQGFLVSDYLTRFEQGAADLATYVDQGKLQFRDDIVEGFEHTLTAFGKLFDGSNSGKVLVKL